MSKKDASENLGLPGSDPDPDADVEAKVKIAWALVGIFFTVGVFSFILDRFGFSVLPGNPTPGDFVRLAAFCVAALNILFWMWFPLEDLAVLRNFVRTESKILPATTAQFFSIILAMALVLALMVGALLGPLWFGLAGMAVYLWNLIGFHIIRGHLRRDERSDETV